MIKLLFADMALIDDPCDLADYENLYKSTRLKAYITAFKILRNETLAEEAVSESYLKIAENFQKIHNLNAHKKEAYIVITVRNTSLNMLKKETKIEIVEYNDEIDLAPQIEHIREQRLAELIAELSATDKEILYLRYTLKLGYDEIAIALGISSAAARQRMRFAKKNLKELLEREENDV